MTYMIGQVLRIPCEVSNGPFAGECMISIETGLGSHSGFVRSDSVEVGHDGKGWVTGRIVQVDSDRVVVRFDGSFFTTAAGVAQISQQWATAHASHSQ